MREVEAFEAKTRLSELLVPAEQGESVTITHPGTPVARLVPVAGPGRAEALRCLSGLRARLTQQGVSLSAEDILSARDEGRR